jgi:glycosyltransferase involved in cell wall biosynthesis
MTNEFFSTPVNSLLLFKESLTDKITSSTEVLSEILFITSYPNRECGIATYSQDLITAIQNKFNSTYSLSVCALEATERDSVYPAEVKYVLNTSNLAEYNNLATHINNSECIKLVLVEHEFGLFGGDYGDYFLQLLALINKPVITTFHTVLPEPTENRKAVVQAIIALSANIVVMTKSSANILVNDYAVSSDKIIVIPHGTHLAKSNTELENKNYLKNKLVLSTFGLISSGKSIETALEALPAIIENFPNILYLIIGKTHPSILKSEGEVYRNFLERKVIELNLQNHVRFINKYLSLEELQAYLYQTTIYLFTSKDRYQAVSGTFAYAMASGCPIISTPIPHAKEMLNNGAGLIVDFQNAKQLANTTIKLLSNSLLLQEMKLNGLHKISPTAWQNSAIAHIELIQKNINKKEKNLQYTLPVISLQHIKRLTTTKGMIQFASIANPDYTSGYTIDDNARALIAVTKHYKLTRDNSDLVLIKIYLNFILFCQQKDGSFLNYVDIHEEFLEKNKDENLEDANGRAIWALGEFLSYENIVEPELTAKAEAALDKSLNKIPSFKSPRAIAFSIKGLYLYNVSKKDALVKLLITSLADNLVSKYRGVSDEHWKWFEDYLTYANSLLPEAMLYAYLNDGSILFRTIAINSFDFLLSVIFQNNQIKVISNQGWRTKGKASNQFGEQPIDVAYTVMALSLFYDTV